MARRIITARQQYAMLSPWRVAAPLQQRPSRPGEAPPDYRDLWQRPHGLDADFDPFDDLDFDEGRYAGLRTAGPRRRFNQDWQHIGGDYFPLDVITHYMDRKGEGFGDEKAPLYEMSGRPPLSQQIEQDGYEKPVDLCTDGQSGCVYDGHHRIDVARQLGHTHVPVVVTWRNSSGYGNEGAYSNKVEPWLKKWLTDMRGGRETVGRRTTAAMQWYHTSPYKLPVGTELTPGGGKSRYEPYYRALGEPDRKNHVWVEHRPDLLKRWHDIDADTNYHYRVEPVGGNPRPYRDGDYSQGWVVPRARIVEELGPAKRRRKGSADDYRHWMSRTADAGFASPAVGYYDPELDSREYARHLEWLEENADLFNTETPHYDVDPDNFGNPLLDRLRQRRRAKLLYHRTTPENAAAIGRFRTTTCARNGLSTPRSNHE